MDRTVSRYGHLGTAIIAVVALLLVLSACATGPSGTAGDSPDTANPPAGGPAQGGTTRPAGPVCDQVPPGPREPPPGAVTIETSVAGALATRTENSPPGTTFWLAPGTHTLGAGQFDQVAPKDGDTYIGAPGAVLDGHHTNDYAFTGHARDVTISHLTVQGFTAPQNEGVVNHDSGNGWTIAANTIQHNAGAAMMVGAHQRILGNCLRANGQYGINAYQAGNGITDVLVAGNEIAGNNTDDWEKRQPGCGCSGGTKFWSVNGAIIRNNWIHDNRGPGLWADTNNNNFLIEGNIIDNNDSEAIFYETSYNAIIRNNVIRDNMLVAGKQEAKEGDNFPFAAIYISESGGEPRVPARTDRIQIYRNTLQNNWSGITLWENADRFCNSPTNPTDDCTLLVKDRKECTQPGIASAQLRSDCRWKTQRVDIHDNRFVIDPDALGCSTTFCGRMALLSNWGTYPDWSPYKGPVIEDAITFHQSNRWHDNSYLGPWHFVVHDTDRTLDTHEWQNAPYRQDHGSTFTSTGGG